MDDEKKKGSGGGGQRYTWPWFVLAGVVLGILLAVIWMSKEVARLRQRRDPNFSMSPGVAESGSPQEERPKGRDNSWTNGMVWIPGGTFWMGSDDGQSDEKPAHQVTVEGFWMDQTEVTNEQFEKFARAARYMTVAERKPDA